MHVVRKLIESPTLPDFVRESELNWDNCKSNKSTKSKTLQKFPYLENKLVNQKLTCSTVPYPVDSLSLKSDDDILTKKKILIKLRTFDCDWFPSEYVLKLDLRRLRVGLSVINLPQIFEFDWQYNSIG